MTGRPEANQRLILATAAVTGSMVALFLLPSSLFIPMTFVATGVMVVASYLTGSLVWKDARLRAIVAGLASAGLLYFIFYLGNAAVSSANLAGAGPASERSIYALIASPSNPLSLQIAVLAFDAVGYESFFRGTLQKRLAPRAGVLAAPAVALMDATIHLATFNILWVGTTFVADLVWGLTYHYGKGLPASTTSHFVWDLAIFIVRPIL